jgi:hypothetical protein
MKTLEAGLSFGFLTGSSPARYQYREAFVLVEALFERTPSNYCPYIFVDNDAAIARGWAQGFPKKLGSIYQTQAATGAPDEEIVLGIQKVPSSQAMEMGLIVPDVASS